MTFDQLSDEAKEKARENERRHMLDYDWWDWWDCVYEDAVRIGSLMGIEIDERTRPGRKEPELSIYFSGFGSQGDGASFEGTYTPKPDAIKAIQNETNDEELLRIATELTVLQVVAKLSGHGLRGARIKTQGRYAHSGGMYVEVHDDLGEYVCEEPLTDLMRAFADWIYRSLECESEYLTSDECIDERLRDETFDEDGDII